MTSEAYFTEQLFSSLRLGLNAGDGGSHHASSGSGLVMSGEGHQCSSILATQNKAPISMTMLMIVVMMTSIFKRAIRTSLLSIFRSVLNQLFLISE